MHLESRENSQTFTDDAFFFLVAIFFAVHPNSLTAAAVSSPKNKKISQFGRKLFTINHCTRLITQAKLQTLFYMSLKIRFRSVLRVCEQFARRPCYCACHWITFNSYVYKRNGWRGHKSGTPMPKEDMWRAETAEQTGRDNKRNWIIVSAHAHANETNELLRNTFMMKCKEFFCVALCVYFSFHWIRNYGMIKICTEIGKYIWIYGEILEID